MGKPLALTCVVLMLAAGQVSADTAADACTQTGAQELQARLVQTIQSAVNTPYAKVELQAMAEASPLQYKTLKLLTRLPSSRVALEMTGQDCRDGKPRTVIRWFKLQAWREAWVYGRDARPEQDVMAAAPRKELIDVAAAQISDDELVADPAGQWLLKAANAGRPVLKKQLGPEPLVRRNEAINVIVQGTGLRLQTKGTALQNGALGAQVPVLVNGSASSTPAIVSARGEVHVEI